METQEKNIVGLRLAPQQRRLWQQQQGRTGTYCARCIVSIDGALEVDRLKKALAKVVARHEILRTAFRSLPEMTLPIQVVTDQSVSLSESILEEQIRSIADLAEELANRAGDVEFDFENGQLFDATLIRITPMQYLLRLSMPALCADAVGLRNVIFELARCYAELGGVGESSPIQYADLAEWQNGLLEKEESEPFKQYWMRGENRSAHQPRLAFERRVSEHYAFDPDYVRLTVPGYLAAKAERMAQSLDASPPDVLLACLHVLLRRYTGKSQVTIGVRFDGRSYEGLEEAPGLFEKYLPLLTESDDAALFCNLVSQLHQSMEESGDRQEYFDWQGYESARDAAPQYPAFCFSFAHKPESITAAGARLSFLELDACVDRFKLKAAFAHDGNDLAANFYFDRNFFYADDVRELARRFLLILESASEGAENSIASLRMVAAIEEPELLAKFAEATDSGTPGEPFLDLFEASAAAYPDRIALVIEDQRFTYAELNRCANQIAHHLRALGAWPDDPVPICFGRSAEMILAMLGVLKAGGAYVPLDPAQPQARLLLMLEDLRASVVLTQESIGSSLPHGEARLVFLDREHEAIASHPDVNPPRLHSEANLFYLLFTSGSTGKPKAVGVEHRQVANYTFGIRRRLSLGPGATYAMASTFAADLGNTAILPSLASAGCLHVIAQDRLLAPDELGEYVARHNIDCLKIVPGHLEALMTGARPEQALPRKRLVLGGEASRWDLIERIRELAPGCAIINHYGPTETTVGVLTHEVETSACRSSETAPLGQPIANTQVYLIDDYLRPVPTWIAGQMYIGGDSVARGYINRPDLTAERFAPDLFARVGGARLYRTGDLARRLPDGSLEFLGRADTQVKLRGFRIEIGEIELLLNQHPAVRKAAVLLQQEEKGESRLVGYVVPEAGAMATAKSLRDFLGERLPDYMVPATYMFLRAFPLTPNGKIDRAALPTADFIRGELRAEYIMPQNDVQRRIASVWSEILQIDQVGISDHFFDLGGHSLLMVKIHSRLEEIFGRKLSIVELFKYPTVSALSDFLSQENAGQLSFDKVNERAKRQREVLNRRGKA